MQMNNSNIYNGNPLFQESSTVFVMTSQQTAILYGDYRLSSFNIIYSYTQGSNVIQLQTLGPKVIQSYTQGPNVIQSYTQGPNVIQSYTQGSNVI